MAGNGNHTHLVLAKHIGARKYAMRRTLISPSELGRYKDWDLHFRAGITTKFVYGNLAVPADPPHNSPGAVWHHLGLSGTVLCQSANFGMWGAHAGDHDSR